MSIILVTSFNSALYERYGKRFVEGFSRHVTHIRLVVVFEGTKEETQSISAELEELGVLVLDMETSTRGSFAKRFGHFYEARGYRLSEVPGGGFKIVHNYRWDALRFSFKVFALEAALNWLEGSGTECDLLGWIDADVVCHSSVAPNDLDEALPSSNELMSYLGRTHFPPPRPYSEGGFFCFNLAHPKFQDFIKRLISYYHTGEVFELSEWHDCMVWDCARREFELAGVIFRNISGNFVHLEHPFVNSLLGKYFDHLKGESRKLAGRSHGRDFANG